MEPSLATLRFSLLGTEISGVRHHLRISALIKEAKEVHWVLPTP